jgi:glycerate 2-kinase
MKAMHFDNYRALTAHGREELRADALAIAASGLKAADPAAELARSLRLEGDRLVVRGQPIDGLDRRRNSCDTVVDLAGRRLFLLGAGKATLGMAEVLDELLGPRFTDAAVVVKRGQARASPLHYVEVLEAAHPVPDESSLAGGLRLLALSRKARAEDVVIGLVTGGSSALAVAPAEGISLADKIETNRLLLASGADIVSMNSVRKHLSAIKGGRLGLACGCRILNFTASDVVGDPLDYITDLTVPDSSTWGMAQATCDRFALWRALPPAVEARLRLADPDQETPKGLPSVCTWVMADAARMCAAAVAEAAARGYDAELLGLDWEGEARDAGIELVRHLLTARPHSCLIAGGENTVTLAGGTADGLGGPNQEAALAAALALAEGPAAAVICLDSDGSDGPTDAAGGLVDDLTAAAASAAGLDIAAALAAHATHHALCSVGDLVVIGTTGTNVNDLKVALRGGASCTRVICASVVEHVIAKGRTFRWRQVATR